MDNGERPFEPFKLPEFPTLFSPEEAERLRDIEEQRKRMEEVYRGKFTPEEWAKVPLPEKAIRRLLPPWVAPATRVLTPWEWGWEFGFTPEQAEKERLELEEEYKELVRKERVSRLLPSIKTTLRALALTDEDMVTDISELRSVFKLDELGFTEEEAGYISAFAQRLIHATPEEIISGEVFEMPALTQEEVDELARAAIQPRQVLTTIALSKNLEDITAALQEMYAPQVVDDIRREAIIKEFAEGLEGATKKTTGEVFGKIAEEEGEVLILTDMDTGTMVSASKKADDSVWVEGELIGSYDKEQQKIIPLSLSGDPLKTEEEKESAIKDWWDAAFLSLSQSWLMVRQFVLNAIPAAFVSPFIPEEKWLEEKGVKPRPELESLVKRAQQIGQGFQQDYLEREQNYQKWLVEKIKTHPELAPRPEWEEPLIDRFKRNPMELLDVGYLGYQMASNVHTYLAVGITIGVTYATKNPMAGLGTAMVLFTPLETESLRQDLIDSGASYKQATQIAVPGGVFISSLEGIGNLPILKAVAPQFFRELKRNIQRGIVASIVQYAIKTPAKIITVETFFEEVPQEIFHNAFVKTVDEHRDLLENVPETVLQSLVATAPLGFLGGGAEYMNMRRYLPKDVLDKLDTDSKKIQEAGMPKEQSDLIAYNKLMETETGQAAVLLALEKFDAEVPAVSPPVGKNREVIGFLEGISDEVFIKLYHGTSRENAKSILASRRLLPDDMQKVGLATTYDEALGYALRKDRKNAVVVEVTVRRSELGLSDTQLSFAEFVATKAQIAGKVPLRFFEPEVGGTGRNEILVGDLYKKGAWELSLQAVREVVEPPAVEVAKPIADKTVTLETKLTAINKDIEIFNSSLAVQEGRLEKTTMSTERTELTETIDGMKETLSELEIQKVKVNKQLVKLRKATLPVPEVTEPPAEEIVVPELDPRRRMGLPVEPDTRQETLDKRPRIQDWSDEQEAVTVAMEANPTIANATQLGKDIVEIRGRAERTWNEADEETRKGIRKEAHLSKSVIAKDWSDMTPPEQQALTLTAIPDRSIHFPIAREIFDIRYYMQYLQEETGMPFYEIFKRAELAHGGARIVQEGFLQRIGTDPFFASIRSDEAALLRVAQEINSRNPALKIESPEGLTDNELMLANVIEDMYHQYEGKVRYLRVVHTTGTIEALKQEFPDAPEGELAITVELMKIGNEEDLFTYLDTLDWGVIGSGYDPWMVSYPTLVPRKIRIGTVRGAARLMRRESVEFSELKMERNVLLRLATYLKQVEAQWRLEPELSVLSDMWTQAGVKFSNVGQVESALREWTRELQGIPTRNSLLDAVVRRVWRQSMGTIFVHIYMAVRNFHQHIVFHPDRTELARIRELPADMREKAGVYYDDFVSQLKGIRREWLYMGEKGIPVPGFGALLRLADRFSQYPHSDNIPRRWSFLAATNKARRATEQYRRDNNITRWLRDSGAVHLRQTERNYALRLLAQPTHDLAVPGLREVTGDEMASFYVGHEVANMTHFIYERAFRAPVEYGATGRTLFNLIVFPRGYFQRLFFQAQKLPNLRSVFSPDTNWEQARAGFKDIILLFVIGEFMSNWLRLLTGRKRRSYAPLEIIQWELGGLAIGAFQDLQALLNDVWTILDIGADEEAKEAALNRIPGELTRGAQTQVPFYRYLIDGLDAIFDTRNIEVQYIRKLRTILDESYTPEELDEIDRNTWEKLRLAILGGDVADPTVFEQMQSDLLESLNRLGEMDVRGNFYTLRQFGGEVSSKTKPLPDAMITEEYGFPELTVFYKECEDRWKELYKLPSVSRKEWRASHLEEEAMLLFWGKFASSVYRLGTPEWEQVSSLLRTWFSYYSIDARMHSKYADWTLPVKEGT